MAKDKKKITDFRQALLSNSQFIAKDSEKPASAKEDSPAEHRETDFRIELEESLFKKLEKTAAAYHLDLNEFANLALDHVLSISYVQKQNT
ncbi:MAG TPA: hypothetical protein VK861_01865 [Bacteroidales bacterium]|jgi:hypothetical protein|nr:hypothetical protein [Bacteroidales bacterium]